MNIRRHVSTTYRNLALAVIFAAVATVGGFFAMSRVNAADQQAGRLVTIYDRGEQKVLLSQGETVGDALKEAGIDTDDHDVVEPALSEKMIASEYKVNIYRARPVTIVDGAVRKKVMTPYQTPVQIAKDAGITLYSEDETRVSQSSDYLYSGAGLQLSIHRATPVQLTLYGKTAVARTQGATVADMLREKDITLGEHDRVSPALETPITENLEARVWREGKQTVTVEEEVAFPVESIKDGDRPIGFREVRTAGEKGVRNVTYEVIVQDGQEVGRTEIASVTTKEPAKQVEIVGVKSLGNGLTKSKGVFQFTDSAGITHRETYYDLPMNVVMRNCGAGGFYTVREDGVKVDRAGYVIIAANLGNYPRCSVVETSVGLGKVYDTGGFAVRHPYGFDIATDWSNYDGI